MLGGAEKMSPVDSVIWRVIVLLLLVVAGEGSCCVSAGGGILWDTFVGLKFDEFCGFLEDEGVVALVHFFLKASMILG